MRLKAGDWLLRRRRALYRWAHILLPLLLLSSVAYVNVAGWDEVERLQYSVFDSFQRRHPREYQDVPVRIVDLDDETLERMGQWPWPRTLMARLVRRLNELGASVVAFDVVFSEPDRTSPARVLSLWPQTPETAALKDLVKRLPDHDKVFANAIAGGRVVTGFVLIPEKTGKRPLVKSSIAYSGGREGDDPATFLFAEEGVIPSLPELEKAAAGNGTFSYVSERDGVVRRVPLLMRVGDLVVPSLSTEALRVAQGARNITVKLAGASGEKSFGGTTGIAQVKIGQIVIPTDPNGRVWIHFTRPAPRRTIPVWKVFRKDFDAGSLEGAIVFLGTSAAGLKDLRSTPLNPAAPGVELHAQLAEQALLQHFLLRPDWAADAELLFMVVLGLALIFLLPRVGAAWCAALGLGAAVFAFAFSWHAFTAWRWLFEPVLPTTTVVAVYVASTFIGYLKSEAERRQVKGAFSRYMSPTLVEQLARHPEKLKLGGEMRDMTLLFCDIRGFTAISEKFQPQELTHLINQFLTPMTQIILDHQGTIDKYMGDCIMAFWNAPLDDPGHAVNACRSAFAMMTRLGELNVELEAEAQAQGRPFTPIHVGIGLNTGPCCVGNMGSTQRFDYSVLGDDVNLASRLEGQSKTYGADIVVGPRTREQAKDFPTLELDVMRVKGKTQPVHIYALLGDERAKEGEGFKEIIANNHRMLSAYRTQDWAGARGHLEACRSTRLLPGLYDLYEKRIAAYEKESPGSNWDGVFTAVTK